MLHAYFTFYVMQFNANGIRWKASASRRKLYVHKIYVHPCTSVVFLIASCINCTTNAFDFQEHTPTQTSLNHLMYNQYSARDGNLRANTTTPPNPLSCSLDFYCFLNVAVHEYATVVYVHTTEPRTNMLSTSGRAVNCAHTFAVWEYAVIAVTMHFPGSMVGRGIAVSPCRRST